MTAGLVAVAVVVLVGLGEGALVVEVAGPFATAGCSEEVVEEGTAGNRSMISGVVRPMETGRSGGLSGDNLRIDCCDFLTFNEDSGDVGGLMGLDGKSSIVVTISGL